MKFRIKFHSHTYSIAFEQITDELSIARVKDQLRQRLFFSSESSFHLSLNGKTILDENQTVSQSGLVNGDTIYILGESGCDHALTLDQVRGLTTYPVLLHRLVECSQPENEFDHAVVVLHALMLESGFRMDAENNYDLRLAKKSATFYVIRYRHKLCEEDRLRCSLAIMRTGSLVTIDGVVNALSQACGKLSFNIENYFYTQKQAADLNARLPYRDLCDLSRLFKDNLANRLLCKLLEESGQRSSATLIGLPNEIKLRLAKYLPVDALLALQSTCRDIYNTLTDNLLWHDLCHRDFDGIALKSLSNTIENSSSEKNWYQSYRILYTQRQATLRHQNTASPVFHPAFFPLTPPGHPTHRGVLFPDPTNTTPPTFHPFPPAIYRPIPPGMFRLCSANSQQISTPQQQAQLHLYCQPLKWVVIFAAATMISFPSYYHPVWLG